MIRIDDTKVKRIDFTIDKAGVKKPYTAIFNVDEIKITEVNRLIKAKDFSNKKVIFLATEMVNRLPNVIRKQDNQ